MNYQSLYAELTSYRSASREELEDLGWTLTRNQTMRHPEWDDIEVPLTRCSVALKLIEGTYYWLPGGILPVESYIVVTDYNRN